MSKPRQGYRHFDLPVDWLETSGGWVPPKSHDTDEIKELEVLPPGSVIARRQQVGVEVASKMLDFMSSRDISNFGPQILAAAGLVTAWHNHAEGIEHRMRRVLHLPVHMRSEEPISRESLVQSASERYDEATATAGYVTNQTERKGAAKGAFEKQLGLNLGDTSMVLASVPYAAAIERARTLEDDELMQHYARTGAGDVKTLAREARGEIGVYPSLAQFADRYGPLPGHIYHEGDSALREALDYAQTTVFEAEAA